MRIILSTFGPLHLIKSAEYLSKLVNIKVIQGWIPSWWNKWLLKPISRVIGYDLGRTIKKRTPKSLIGHNVGLGLPEFFLNAATRIVSDTHKERFTCASYNLYGSLSRKHLKNADIFHVRSGSGRGGAIQTAREQGMIVIADHSIAHPQYMEDSLKEEFERMGVHFDLGISNKGWQMILQDCIEADHILVNSDFVKSTFIQNGFDQDKISVIYLGVRQDFIGLKSNYELQEDGILRILFTGGFGFRKGAEYLLEALIKLDEMDVKYECTVIGNNNGAQPLIEKYKPKGLKLIGFIPQDDLKIYLGNSDIYLFPSLCEGCASSAMEALAAGLPVIATLETGLPMKHDQSGYIIESKSSMAIVEAINKLRTDTALRTKLGVSGSKLIGENYSWEIYAEKVAEMYKNLLKH